MILLLKMLQRMPLIIPPAPKRAALKAHPYSILRELLRHRNLYPLLYHHVEVDLLRVAYLAVSEDASVVFEMGEVRF